MTYDDLHWWLVASVTLNLILILWIYDRRQEKKKEIEFYKSILEPHGVRYE